MPEPPLSPDLAATADAPHESTLGARLAAAAARFAEVAARLDSASAAMRETGSPPDFHLIHALGDCHRDFLRARNDVTRSLKERGLPVPPASELTGLHALEAFARGPLASEGATSNHLAATEPPIAEAGETPVLPGLVPESLSGSEPPPDEPGEPVESAGEVRAVLEPEPAPPEFEETRPGITDASEFPAPSDFAPPSDAEAADPSVALETQPLSGPEEASPFPVAGPDAIERVEAAAFAEPDAVSSVDVARKLSVLEILETAQRIRTNDGGDFASLEACHREARELAEAVDGSPADALPEEAVRLAEGDHPLVSLLAAVRADEALTDAQWAGLHATVTEVYGRQMAVAVARRRLYLADVDGHSVGD